MKKYLVYANGKELPVHSATVSAMPYNRVWGGEQRSLSQTEEAYFVTFDMREPVELEIHVLGEFEKYELRPLSHRFNEQRTGNSIKLTVNRTIQFTVEIDGTHHALHVFANPPSKKPTGDIVYYGPGEHKADLILLDSNQTLYIDEGAVVYGVIYAKDAENIRIMGRGILDSSPYRRGNDEKDGGREIIEALLHRGFCDFDISYCGQLVFHNCKNCSVEGIILRDSQFWSAIIRNNCENIIIDNIKIIGQWRYNSDGIDICASKNIVIKNTFIRSFDDSIVMRGAHMEGELGNVENVTVENCVIWCDWGKSLECWCGYKPTEIKNILFKNCNLIHITHTAMNITVWYGSNNSVVNGIAYEDINVDLDNDYLFCQIQENVDDTFIKKWGAIPHAISVSVEKLGKVSKGQDCEKCEDESKFYVYFGNISYDNIKYFGNKKNLLVRIEKYSDIHVIENITANNCDFLITDYRNS